MDQPICANPELLRLFRRYLASEDAATFIVALSHRYSNCTLERLVRHPNRQTRRAAVLALSLVGTYESNPVLGRALRDSDRGVRMLAENGIRQLWMRDGSSDQRQSLNQLVRWNESGRFDSVIEEAGRLIREAPQFGEAWNQQAIALYHLGRQRDAIESARWALRVNPFHFLAAVTMGHAYLSIRRPARALDCFRNALALCPDLEGIRMQVRRLQRALEGPA